MCLNGKDVEVLAINEENYKNNVAPPNILKHGHLVSVNVPPNILKHAQCPPKYNMFWYDAPTFRASIKMSLPMMPPELLANISANYAYWKDMLGEQS